MLKRLLVLGLAMLMAAGGVAQAQAQTTAEIVKRGRVKIGVLTGAPPYGMIDAQGNPSGYDVDVANLIAKYMGVPVDLVPLTPPARIPALQAGRVDFLVATLAPTPERALTVDFTIPYNAFQMAIMAKKATAITTLDDLKGKTVGVNRGSSQETALNKAAVQGTRITRFEDDSTTAQALIAGQIDSVALPDTIGKEIARTRPDADMETKFIFFQQPNSLAVRKGSDELRQWLNNTIYFIKVSGELNEICMKWTGQPLSNLPTF
ncbi:MAG: transporter substrate-binding domain-containing protein [Gemmatimonadaceae bacterium]|nr:transporter substrate-binding domain-containing protein [Acetobacteraceae bacterium]